MSKVRASRIMIVAIIVWAIAPARAMADLVYVKPDAWTVVKTTSSMRVAQFAVPRAPGDAADGELVLYYFGGSGGSVEANIERWIAQMQQPDGRPSSAVAK